MRSPLGRARGHGAAGAGTAHFIAQRVSAIALLLLGPAIVLRAALAMHAPNYLGAIDFLTDPLNAVGVILLLLAGLTHMSLGMQVVIEDYIQRRSTMLMLLLLNFLGPLALGVGALFALMQINFGGEGLGGL